MTRLDHVASVQARIGWKALTAIEYQADGYAFLATPNIKRARIDFSDVNYISEFRYEESPDLQLRVGDVLLAKDGSTLGIANCVRELPRPTTVNGSIAVLRPKSVDSRFLMYWLQGAQIQARIEQVKDGMGVPHLFQNDIRRFPVPDLLRDEQGRIADFLDDRVARTDRIIAARRRQLSLVAETRAAAADSMLAELWSRQTMFRRYVIAIEQGWSPQCDSIAAPTGEWGVLKLSAIRPGQFRADENKRLPDDLDPQPHYEILPGDLLMTRASTPAMVGMCAVAPDNVRRRLILCDKIMRIQMSDAVDPHFVSLVASTRRVRDHLSAAGTGTSQSMVNIRGEDVRNAPIPVVSLERQRSITAEFARVTTSLDFAGQRLTHSIDLLTEYKSSLITAAVTGDLDVTTAGSEIPAV